MYQKRSGFTMIELLIVLGISGVLMGIAGMNFANQRKSGNLTRAVQSLGQDIRYLRSKAIAKGKPWRLNLSAGSGYTVESFDSGTDEWTLVKTKNFQTGIYMPGQSMGYLEFDSRGYMTVEPPDLAISLSNSENTKYIIPSMSGSIAIMDYGSE